MRRARGATAPAMVAAPAAPAAPASVGAPAAVAVAASGLVFAPGGARILDEVSFEVGRGEIVALIGPNGAGKSTALAALAGDIRLSHGSVTIDDRDLRSLPIAELGRLRSVLLQQSAVAFSYTVREIVMMGRLPWNAVAIDDDEPTDEEIVAQAMRRTDIEHLADRDVTTLSGGEQARAALARVLAQRCGIVMLDEPTAALDIGHQEQVLQLARELADGGVAVLVVLHDLGLAAAYADRVVVMDHGRVVADGVPHEVMTGELLSRVYRYPIEVIRHAETGELLVTPVRSVWRS
ncbi:heme ABC transporter ATP-binding protein [Leifsonia kafniensis]|uniref:Heme ABC transporter ATP-binding protein n=1 Tax=Leifsonia kafniensis TaxID=475957 RepID=A0ABP7KIZ4_9MICO